MHRYGLVLVAASAMLGCGEPAGVVRVHFALEPPAMVDFAGLAPPAIDPLALSRAEGTLDATPTTSHMVVSFVGLPPPPADPHMVYRLRLSASMNGGGWVHAADVEPAASGAGFAHLRQRDVPLGFATVRSAILTLDPHEATEPSVTIILSGAAEPGSDVDLRGGDAGSAGGHMH